MPDGNYTEMQKIKTCTQKCVLPFPRSVHQPLEVTQDLHSP